MYNLSEKVILTNLHVRQWTGRSYDDEITREVEKEHNARNAGNFNKILIDEVSLKKVQKVAGKARAFLYSQTLPWGDNGDRLLPSENYFDFVREFYILKSEFNATVQEFLDIYPTLKEEAQKRLNGMYKESDYPDLSKLAAKFQIDIAFMPIANPQDIRIKLNDDEIENLKAQVENEMNIRINLATKEIWERLHKTISHMVERLSDKNAVFRDSLITNLEELVNVLPKLNFTADQNITDTIENIKSLLVDPTLLRVNTKLRSQKAQEAKEILDRVSGYMS